MAHLIRKYSFPPERDMMRPPTLVDPVSTSWYNDTLRKKSATDIARVLTGTDVISAKIRESLSASGRPNQQRDIPDRYSMYLHKNNNTDVIKASSGRTATTSGKLDLYGVTDNKHSKSMINGDIPKSYPSRINDYTSSGSSATQFPMSTYASTYTSTYGAKASSIKEPNPYDTIKSKYEPKTNVVKFKSSAVPSYDKTDYMPTNIHRGAGYGTDQYYMQKLGEILNVHSSPLFTSSPSMVTDYMYVGGYKDAENWQYLRRLGITHVLNMAALRKSSYNPYPPQSGIVGYEAFDADDHEMYNVMQHFPRAKAFIDRARWSNGKVLVHCAMGVNRSGTMCCAYLMAEHKMALIDAAKKMKKARGTTLCNRGFQKQLLRFARQKGHL